MVPSAQQVRTSLVLTAAGAAITAAFWLAPGTPHAPPPDELPTSDLVSARFTSTQIMAGEQDVAVTITMPTGERHVRPPLALAIVIDRSGSMNGTPLANAKAAAKQLVAQLDQSDAFSIVTFSSGDETVAPMALATPANKLAAERDIDGIYDDGGTCTSCGLTRATHELEARDAQDRLHRIVLMSDGQANEGIWDKQDLVRFAGTIAARGTSISAVGVGLDFDEVTMTNIANVGHGNYYFVEDTANLSRMFERELSGLTETVGVHAMLSVPIARDLEVLDAYGYPLMRGKDGDLVPIADLRAGESRKVVLHVRVNTGFRGAIVQLGYERVVDNRIVTAQTGLTGTITQSIAAVNASADPAATRAVEEALSAKALEDAAATYERDGAEAAKNVLEQRARVMHAKSGVLGPDAVRKLDTINGDAIDSFSKAPAAKATKAVRVKSYELAR